MPFLRKGYGQVEPNQLSAQKTGQIYASLPLDTEVDVLQNGEFMFYDYANGTVNAGKTADATTGTLDTAITEPYLVFNEIKLYEPFWRTSYKDFAMIRVNGVDASGNKVPGENYVTSGLATAGYGDGATTAGVVPSTTNPPSMADTTGHTEYPYRMDGMAPRLFKTDVGDIFTTNMVTDVGANVTYVVGDKLVPTKNTTTNTLQLKRDNTATTGMIWQVIKVYSMPDNQDGLKLQRIQ